MAKHAKKRVPISELKKLMQLHPSHEEIAAYFGISVESWKRLLKKDPAVAAAYEAGQGLGKIGLRRKQFALASYSAPMAIHLGKIYLGQEDRSKLELSGPDGNPIQNETVFDFSKLNDAERNTLRATLEKAVGRS
jgi:hypothetical protein